MLAKEALELYTAILESAFPIAFTFFMCNKILRLFMNGLDGELSWD